MSTSMEESGLLAVDCVVVCCCCPCLLLQVTVFLFIRLPRKLAVKSKRIVLRRLRKESKTNACSCGIKGMREKAAFGSAQEGYDLAEGHSCIGDRNSFLEAEKVLEEMMSEDSSWVEANKVWEELIAEEGLFWFGSFWGITS